MRLAFWLGQRLRLYLCQHLRTRLRNAQLRLRTAPLLRLHTRLLRRILRPPLGLGWLARLRLARLRLPWLAWVRLPWLLRSTRCRLSWRRLSWRRRSWRRLSWCRGSWWFPTLVTISLPSARKG